MAADCAHALLIALYSRIYIQAQWQCTKRLTTTLSRPSPRAVSSTACHDMHMHIMADHAVLGVLRSQFLAK